MDIIRIYQPRAKKDDGVPGQLLGVLLRQPVRLGHRGPWLIPDWLPGKVAPDAHTSIEELIQDEEYEACLRRQPHTTKHTRRTRTNPPVPIEEYFQDDTDLTNVRYNRDHRGTRADAPWEGPAFVPACGFMDLRSADQRHVIAPISCIAGRGTLTTHV